MHSKEKLLADRRQMEELIADNKVDPANKQIFRATIAKIDELLEATKAPTTPAPAPTESRPPAPAYKPVATAQVPPPATQRRPPGQYVGPKVLTTDEVPYIIQNRGEVTQSLEKRTKQVTIKWQYNNGGANDECIQEKVFTFSELRSRFQTTLRDLKKAKSFPEGEWTDSLTFQRLQGYYAGLCAFRKKQEVTPQDLTILAGKRTLLIFSELAARHNPDCIEAPK